MAGANGSRQVLICVDAKKKKTGITTDPGSVSEVSRYATLAQAEKRQDGDDDNDCPDDIDDVVHGISSERGYWMNRVFQAIH